jgi:hypothetical protein
MMRAGGGAPLNPAMRSTMERSFGTDFSGVRVHRGGPANEANRALNARAFTRGSHLYFGQGASPDNRGLMAHELTHVVQQGDAASLRTPPSFPVDAPGEAAAEQTSDKVMSGQLTDDIRADRGTNIQRIEFGDFVKLGETPEIPEIPPEIPEIPEGPGEFPEDFEGGPDGAPEGGSEGEQIYPPPEPPEGIKAPAESGQGGRWVRPRPVPPVFPVPRTDPELDKERKRRKRRRCGDPELPHTKITYRPGPLGQGLCVKASPLTKCPPREGPGSEPADWIYKEQFECIAAAKQTREWVRGHVLHGRTSKSGDENLHGPGDKSKNLIIMSQSLNQQMYSWVEEGALDLVYGRPSGVLWYQAVVDSYHPGLDFFAESISAEYGLFNTKTGSEGPRLSYEQFPKEGAGKQPPYCPARGFAPGFVPYSRGWRPDVTPGFESTIKICHRALKSRVFNIADGGLKVEIHAEWVAEGPGKEAAGEPGQPEGCPIQNYRVNLYKGGLYKGSPYFGELIGTSKVRSGEFAPLQWRYLPDDDYHLEFLTENVDPNCCLEGNITVTPFAAHYHNPTEIA